MSFIRRPKRTPRITRFPHTILPSREVKLTLEQLCCLYRLTVEINRRAADITWASPIYASIRGLDIRERGTDGHLTSVYVSPTGNGKTPRQALKDLATKLSGQVIAIGWPSERRGEVELPIIIL